MFTSSFVRPRHVAGSMPSHFLRPMGPPSLPPSTDTQETISQDSTRGESVHGKGGKLILAHHVSSAHVRRWKNLEPPHGGVWTSKRAVPRGIFGILWAGWCYNISRYSARFMSLQSGRAKAEQKLSRNYERIYISLWGRPFSSSLLYFRGDSIPGSEPVTWMKPARWGLAVVTLSSTVIHFRIFISAGDSLIEGKKCLVYNIAFYNFFTLLYSSEFEPHSETNINKFSSTLYFYPTASLQTACKPFAEAFVSKQLIKSCKNICARQQLQALNRLQTRFACHEDIKGKRPNTKLPWTRLVNFVGAQLHRNVVAAAGWTVKFK